MKTLQDINPAHLERIRESFPNLAIHDVEINKEGLVNEVIIVNRERVFRFAKSEWGKTALRNEAKAVELARQYVDMRLPLFDVCTDSMVSYEFIPGEALLRDDIMRFDSYTQDRLAESLAIFLSQLHSIGKDELDKHQIGPSETVRTRDDWLKLYNDVQRDIFPLLMAHGKEWVKRLFAPLVADDAFMKCDPVFINGDLAPYHLLCERSSCQLTGIIDFGTAGIGDPAADFACLIKNYGESFVQRIVSYYPESKQHIQRARFWAGTLTLQWLLRGIQTQDYSWFTLDIGLASDVMPIGS